jgi:hypothetical protein
MEHLIRRMKLPERSLDAKSVMSSDLSKGRSAEIDSKTFATTTDFGAKFMSIPSDPSPAT